MHMDPETYCLPVGEDAGNGDPSLADDSTVPHLCAASRVTEINMGAGTVAGTDIDADAGTDTGTGTDNTILDTNISKTRLPHGHQNRHHHSQDEAAPSLYTRLVSMLQHKEKDRSIGNTIFPTPPASPEIRQRNVCALNSSPPLDQQAHTGCISPGSASVISENPLALWTPLTPDSFDHNHQHSGRRRSDVWPKLDCLSQEIGSSADLEDTIQTGPPHLSGKKDLQLHSPNAVGQLRDTRLGLGACLNSPVDLAGLCITADLRHQKEDVHGDGNHITQGIQLGEEGEDDVAGRSGSVKLGKTRAPPIPWDVLIDDLSSPVSLTWDTGSGSYGSSRYGYQTVAECEDDSYDLQYVLEISRRDRRKTMDSNPNSAGEYSKSRESWAILHANRAMPADQEYWYRYWLHWHKRLEERQAVKTQKAKRKEAMKRYQMVEPWPLSDRRTARHPRRADEELHPNLRLVRHRTRSAPGRVHV